MIWLYIRDTAKHNKTVYIFYGVSYLCIEWSQVDCDDVKKNVMLLIYSIWNLWFPQINIYRVIKWIICKNTTHIKRWKTWCMNTKEMYVYKQSFWIKKLYSLFISIYHSTTLLYIDMHRWNVGNL